MTVTRISEEGERKTQKEAGRQPLRAPAAPPALSERSMLLSERKKRPFIDRNNY